MNLLEHGQHSLIGTSMIRPPQRSNPSGNTGKRICEWASCDSHSWCWGILLMICMTDPNHFQSSDNLICNFELISHWVWEHHVEKVLHVTIIFLGPNNRKSHRSSVSICCESGHLGDKLNGQLMPVLLIIEIVIRVKKGRQGSNHTYHNGHGMSLRLEPLIKLNHFLIQHHFAIDGLFKPGQFVNRRKFPIQK